jgi:hypothetical protein
MGSQPRGNRRRTGPPVLRGARAVGGQGLGQELAYAGMRQAEVVVALVQGELLTQPVLALA